MPCFYHYTDDEGAENIIRTGTILASVQLIENAGTAFGNGVYLTALSPETSTKQQIAKNNWQNISFSSLNKVKNYFVLDIPDSDIKDTKAVDRNIFLFGHRNDLRLHKYKWVLKKFDSGATIASYKYRISSSGHTPSHLSPIMGDYVMVIDETANGRPVYKRVKGSEWYLFMSSKGKWMVGLDPEEDKCGLFQTSNYSLGPHQNVPWKYLCKGAWNSDNKLNVTAYGGVKMVFCFDRI